MQFPIPATRGTPLKESGLELQDGCWSGKRTFIIGGGPSLRGFDFSLLSGECVIGTNMAFLHDPPVNLIVDLDLMQRLSADPRWQGYRGNKVWLNANFPAEHGRFPGVLELKPRQGLDNKPQWSRSLKDGLFHGTNTGASALNLADVLGASVIYLLGFDMSGAVGKTANWHDEYKDKQDERVYEDFAVDFIRNLANIRAKVYNLNPNSGLRCFPFGRVEDSLACATTP